MLPELIEIIAVGLGIPGSLLAILLICDRIKERKQKSHK